LALVDGQQLDFGLGPLFGKAPPDGPAVARKKLAMSRRLARIPASIPVGVSKEFRPVPPPLRTGFSVLLVPRRTN
jgi:hypothetical protein